MAAASRTEVPPNFMTTDRVWSRDGWVGEGVRCTGVVISYSFNRRR